jgi:hypothetical protein
MEWVKCYTGFLQHRKRYKLTTHDIGVWFLCLLYVGQQEHRDGFIPRAMVQSVCGHDDATTIGGRLVDAGLWTAAEDGWLIHDIEEWQDFDAVAYQRERNRQKQAAHRARRRAEAAGEEAKSHSVTGYVTVTDNQSNPFREEETQSPQVTCGNPGPQSARAREDGGISGVERQDTEIFPAETFQASDNDDLSADSEPSSSLIIDPLGGARRWLPSPAERDYARAYRKAYAATHGGKPPPLPGPSIDIARLAEQALQGGTDPEDIRRAVESCGQAGAAGKEWEFARALEAVQRTEAAPSLHPPRPNRFDVEIERLIRRAQGGFQ